MNSEYPLYLIPLLPLLGAACNLLLGKRLGKAVVTSVATSAVAFAMILSWYGAYLLHENARLVLHSSFFDGAWFRASELATRHTLEIKAGLVLDRLSSLMTLVVTTVGFLIHVYSTGYMDEDEGYHRFFGYLNLFTAAMLILVLGDSLPVTFVGWEGVGLCSYLLIGFWFTKEANAYAGRKAFIVNRVGDFGFLLGMFMLFCATSTLNYSELAKPDSLVQLAQPFRGQATYGTIAMLFIFLGCTGKSAQLPLYIWLPDAMAGPTPVSALIHAATMVTAGVYLLARLHFVLQPELILPSLPVDPFPLGLIAVIGAITALFAASMGFTQRPIKKILAYSTISQLGFMFIGVGTRGFSAGVFHLMTHAFFKAGLFLGAGSIMHALGNEEDVMKMGGLKHKMPITRWTYLIYCLAIAGIFPFAGFFSKDAILAGALSFDYVAHPAWPHWLGKVVYGTGLVAAMGTSFYMFRSYFLVFEGEYRGPKHTWDHAHESPPAMAWPLIVLAVGSVVLGFLGIPKIGEHFEGMNFLAEDWLPRTLSGAPEPAHAELFMLVATAASLLGIGGAWALYGKGPSPALEGIVGVIRPLYRLVDHKYYVDELYDVLVVRPLRKTAWALWRVIDSFVIDLVLVRGSAAVVDRIGRLSRYLQSGDVQRYVVGLIVGATVLLFLAAKWGPHRAAQFDVEVNGNDIVVRAKPPAPGSPLEYNFDFGDGTTALRQRDPVANHHYQGRGEQRIVVEVADPRWKTSSKQSRTVEIR